MGETLRVCRSARLTVVLALTSLVSLAAAAGAGSASAAQRPADDHVSLIAVDAIATDDVWAVGASWIGGGSTSLTLHWDGNGWEG